MLTFKNFDQLDEHFINLLPGDEEKKRQYAPQVHAMLNKAYAKIGGIAGSGFETPDAMVDKIHMWKLHVKDGAIKAVKMYKDHSIGGRKSVAMATDETPEGKAALGRMVKDDIVTKRSYSEISGSVLGTAKKGVKDLQKYVLPLNRVRELQKGDTITPAAHDDAEVIKNKDLHGFYSRNIGGEPHTKLMAGTPGNKITKR